MNPDTLHTLIQSNDIHTLLVLSDTIQFVQQMDGASCGAKKSWLGLNVHKSIGLFATHALGFDAALLYFDGQLECWFGDHCVLNQPWNIPNTETPAPDVTHRLKQDEMLWKELTERHRRTIYKLSPWLLAENNTHFLCSNALQTHLYPNKTLHPTSTHTLHPEQDGWTLINTETQCSYSNHHLFTRFAQLLNQRKRGTIVDMINACPSDKISTPSNTQLLDACKSNNALAGVGITGQWIVRENYFAFHDPLWQLSCTLRAVQEIIRQSR